MVGESHVLEGLKDNVRINAVEGFGHIKHDGYKVMFMLLGVCVMNNFMGYDHIA